MQNLKLGAELSQVLEVLARANISVIVLKGAALKVSVYDITDVRPFADIDLLVRPEDWYDTCHALEKAGYLPVVVPPTFLSPFNSNDTGELTFEGRYGISIDLHWELVPVEWLRKIILIDLNHVWQTKCSLPNPYDRGYQLEPVALLLHLCIHLVQHCFAHPIGFRDVATILQYYQDFPWGSFLVTSTLWGANTASFVVLKTVASQDAELVPAAVLEHLAPPQWKQKLIASVADPKASMAGKGKYEKNRAYALHVLMADSPGRVASFLVWLFFPGLDWLTDRYRLTNRVSSYLAVFWHPTIVLYHGLSSISTIFTHYLIQKDG